MSSPCPGEPDEDDEAEGRGVEGALDATVLHGGQAPGEDPGAPRDGVDQPVDDVFEFGYRFAYLKISNTVGWVDRYIVDGFVNAVTWGTWVFAGRLTAMQNGRVQSALYATAFGLVVLVWLAWAR